MLNCNVSLLFAIKFIGLSMHRNEFGLQLFAYECKFKWYTNRKNWLYYHGKFIQSHITIQCMDSDLHLRYPKCKCTVTKLTCHRIVFLHGNNITRKLKWNNFGILKWDFWIDHMCEPRRLVWACKCIVKTFPWLTIGLIWAQKYRMLWNSLFWDLDVQLVAIFSLLKHIDSWEKDITFFIANAKWRWISYKPWDVFIAISRYFKAASHRKIELRQLCGTAF